MRTEDSRMEAHDKPKYILEQLTWEHCVPRVNANPVSLLRELVKRTFLGKQSPKGRSHGKLVETL